MCRLVAYTGDEILLANVLVKPDDSLVKQSLLAKETTTPTNGDGFGVGWYVPKISEHPAAFLSVFPAWSDENLLHLTKKIESGLFFAHVRAASIGGVNTYNCHPFIYKSWMFMHNGQIHNFLAIKRAIIQLLDDDIYHWIRGGTDTEHFFALLLQLGKNKDLSKSSAVVELLFTALTIVADLIKQAGIAGPSYYNMCLSDGKRLFATRYCTDKTIEPESLHYLDGTYYWSKEDRLAQGNKTPHRSVLISSEQLTDFNDEWQTVPANHLLIVEADYSIQIQAIPLLE